MDHNLDDSLNLESTIGVDFEQSGDNVVNQEEISLDVGTSHEESIPMEFEHIEEQPMLMDTGSEEIIDFMGEQFTLQEYSVHDDQMTSATTTVEANQQLTSEGMFDLQFETPPISIPASGTITQELQMPSKYITVKAGVPTMRAIAPKKETVVVSKFTAPRQVAIAPKLPKLAPANLQIKNTFGKPFTIASNPVKPVTLVGNRQLSLVKKMTTVGGGQESKGNSVLAQIGKQLVMMPATSGPKIKLVSAGGVRLLGAPDGDQAQLIGPLTGTQPKLTKVIVHGVSGSDTTNQPAVITKMMSGGGNAGTPTTRYVTMHQKTIPISIGNNKVLMASPTKSGVRFAKKQVITIKSPTSKLVPSSSNQGPTKKVVITANPTQNVILKTTAPPKAGHVTKIGPKMQLHQINVPGKGIQYIKLVTNTSSSAKTEPKPQAVSTPKTFVLTDSKGNLIRMTAEKMTSQPPPLVVTGTLTNSGKVVTSKPPQQKLVRIAPITSKSAQAAMQNRGGQSLLAPLSPPAAAPSLPDVATLLDNAPPLDTYEEAEEQRREHTEIDSKAALQALIADAVGSDADSQDAHDDVSGTERTRQDDSNTRQSSEGEDSNSMERPESQNAEHPLIVIPSYMKQETNHSDEHSNFDGARRLSTMINVEVDPYDAYQPSSSQLMGENDLPSDLDMRPRKACNCTKSQCLKLYCDCFANGEFCNRCNCTNCHNNLENEELRQKAIRGCLDRNPNAFRPKIGKSKSGGPEIIRRHNKGCNCKRSGCLKNYCECYEAKIACTGICRCVGCRNVEESLQRRRPPRPDLRPPPARSDTTSTKQPCNFVTMDVIEAVCQCMLASTVQTPATGGPGAAAADPVHVVIEEFARCLQDIISASHQAAPLALLDEAQA